MRITRILVALALPVALKGQTAAPITVEAQRQTLTLQDAIRMAQEQGSAAQMARSTRDAAHFRDDAFNSRLMPQLFLRGTAANLVTVSRRWVQLDGTHANSSGSRRISRPSASDSTRRFRSRAVPSRSARRFRDTINSATRRLSSTRPRRSSSACDRTCSSRARSCGTSACRT